MSAALFTARQIAWEILNAVDREKIWVEDRLPDKIRQAQLDERDARLCRELCLGVVKTRRRWDYVLEQYTRRQAPALALRNLLHLGLYQLFALDKIPVHAALHATVELAKSRFSAGEVKFVNAVLRQAQRQGFPPLPDEKINPQLHAAIEYSFPDYLAERWIRRFGAARAKAMMQAANQAPPLVARVNPLQATREQALQRLAQQGVAAEPGLTPQAIVFSGPTGDPAKIPGMAEGWIYFQDEASQFLGWIVDPQRGDTCMDLCSAPGGKATHLAELLQGSGQVMAYDAHRRKLQRVRENAERLRLGNVRILENVPPDLSVDRVLVDAPCSGLGTLRRHAEARWRSTEKIHSQFGQEQGRLLAQAAPWVKPGGVLVYSTCTTEPEENEDVVHGFLRDNAGFEPAPGPNAQGLPAAEFWAADGFFRTFPDWPALDGMFAARLRRRR